VGPFEEEEEGTGVVSDVVKVKGAESGHPRSPDLRNDTGTAISPISGQQNKVTHTTFPSQGTVNRICYPRVKYQVKNTEESREVALRRDTTLYLPLKKNRLRPPAGRLCETSAIK